MKCREGYGEIPFVRFKDERICLLSGGSSCDGCTIQKGLSLAMPDLIGGGNIYRRVKAKYGVKAALDAVFMGKGLSADLP